MKSKKGLGYVDWVISVGVFLIYVLLIFVYFKPSFIFEEYNPDNLLGLVEKGLKDDGYWQMSRLPLFIDEGPTYAVLPKETANIPLIPGLILNDIFIGPLDETGVTHYDIVGSDLYISIPTIFGGGDEESFWIYNFDGASSNHNYFTGVDCSIIGNCAQGNTDDLFYSYGVMENFVGFKFDKLQDINTNWDGDYEGLKNKWRFPKNKDFGISISPPCTFAYNWDPYNLPPEKDVFALQWADYCIKEDGKKEIVTVQVRIW